MAKSTTTVRAFSALALGTSLLTAVLTQQSSVVARLEAQSNCNTAANPTICENLKPGNPNSEWDVSGAGDASIQGFATNISVTIGQTQGFKINTPSNSYGIDIYRMGYYGGSGARKVASVTPSASLPQNQPNCLTNSSTGLIDCGNWGLSASWTVPADAVSGIYFAKLNRFDTGGSSHIMFVVRESDTASHKSEIVFQTSDTTWQAYNQYGGNSLYVGNPAGRAYKVSYNRPFTTRGTSPEDWVFNAEYPMVRFLESNGYDVSYMSGVDTDRFGATILTPAKHKLFLSLGHDEYWSGTQRANIEAARAAGLHLAFFSGNEMFWKTRWENSIDSSNTPYRTLVTYKETHANAVIDPQDPPTWTGTWRDARFSPPADGGRPENAVTGQLFMVNSGFDAALTVPAALGKMRFWRNTSVATLAAGGTATMPNNTLGYEWDADVDNGFRPNGFIALSQTAKTLSGSGVLLDNGSTYGSGSVTHRLSLYRHSSGALVFGAGTVQWSWGLDSNHDRGSAAADVRMKQATVNLFADMGVQPGTLQSGLVAATASLDAIAPTTVITSPGSGANLASGTPITITGTASEAGGGQLVGVEVSTDGGTKWFRATGTTSWSYAWTVAGSGSVTIKSRGYDDTGNMETPSGGVTVNIGLSRTCPCSIWSNSTTPPAPLDDSDTSSVELGLKFQTEVAGYATGIRFYKGTANVGTHTGSLWTSAGTLLGTVTFTGETASGWQQMNFPAAIALAANTTYTVSYHAPVGHYTGTDPFFLSAGVDNPPLHALRSVSGTGNGVYAYSSSVVFPTNTYNGENYWVDVVFNTAAPVDTTPPTVTAVLPVNGATGVVPGGAITATFSEALNASTVTTSTVFLKNPSNVVVPATVTYSAASVTATITPSAPLAYSTTYTGTVKGGTVNPRVKDSAGIALASDYTWSFTTGAEPPPPPTQGYGGPVLVITSTTNAFTTYYAEILRTEGFTSFTTADLSTVTASTLSGYDVVILGEMPLSGSQVSMFTTWVNGGGNLIAMKPDKQLASLLGLTDLGTFLSNAYLLVNTASGPGVGIVNQTMQFHGPADRYTLNGATAIATLYSTATTATSNPAVSMRTVGSGRAVAFTYDLARSVVYTRQGNPAWSGQERDGQSPSIIRSDDLFFGAKSGDVQPDWVDLNKVQIPQADEQQRLLWNTILNINTAKKPLPRFWYFPRMLKAVVIMTGDDHGSNGTTPRFNTYLSNSTAGCVVANWECIRGTSYIYPSTPITDAQIQSFVAQGFEIGVHINTDCANWTAATLPAFYSDQIAEATNTFPHMPAPKTNRTHCIVWSDYATQPQVALNNGIRLDTNYYYWPDVWVQDRPGMFTGSGMPMRFTTTAGAMIDVYQATSQMTDESGLTMSLHINTLLDNALNSTGYYGAFTANMHTDFLQESVDGSATIVSSAKARNVPVITAKQMLDWLDGRNGSTFQNLTWSGNVLSFTISVGSGANGLRALVPAVNGASPITGITLNGSAISYTLQTIKGVQYAIFTAAAGSYQATYGADVTPPVISGLTAAAIGTTTATINWTTNESSNTVLHYGTVAATVNQTASNAAMVTSHTVSLTGLTPNTTYYYRADSTDASNNTALLPATDPPASFVTAGPFISGTITPAASASGTSVALSGTSSATTTANGSGAYSFNSLSVGSYTVTPTKAGYTFTPVNQPVSLTATGASGVDFTIQPVLITGTISGTGGNGATLTLSGSGSGSATADASGNYTFSGIANGTYTVTPSRAGFTFNPPSQTVVVSGASVSGVGFTAQPITVSGAITPAGNGGGASLALIGASTLNATADASGVFSFSGVPNGTYTLTPSKTGFAFSPSSQSVTVSGASVSGLAFTADVAPTYTLSGAITPAASSVGAVVTLSGASTGTATVDASGNYSFNGLFNGAYTVTPAKTGFTFTPANRPVTISSANATADFTTQVAPAITIDANVTFGRSTSATTIVSPAFSTTAANELILAFVATDNKSATTTISGVTGGGLTWQLVRRTNAQKGTAEIWRAFAASTLTNVTVTGTISQSVAAAITVMSFKGVDTSGTNGANAIGATASGSAASGAPTASLVTTRANSLVVGVGNDWDNDIARTVGPNQTLVSQYLATVGDTLWVQQTTNAVPAVGTTVTINDTAPTGDRYNLTIAEVRTP